MVSKRDEFNFLPPGLPEPEDDGACDHLSGMSMPSIELQSTGGQVVNPALANSKYVIVFVYPMTGSPYNKMLIENEEEWNAIPGACGCTSQSCGYRDSLAEFQKLEAAVYGLSNNSPEYQKEAADRLELDYELLSDEDMAFAQALKLPTLTFHGQNLLRRVTMIFKDNKIVKVFYPIFPPNEDVNQVLDWLVQDQIG